MAWRCGSLSRSLISSARSSSIRSTPPISRFRHPAVSASRLHHRRLSFAHSRNLGELGCTQSFLPLHSTVAVPRLTSHLSVGVRACCELSHGT
ncbi:hypothetical protein Nepgr_004669 [Nepenthes gracilis]|uniref:Uncharacterized protein n=1 Tax=Nepenthes gracilis TaxID=150966 RepID=A0AAD3S1T9_NEPGR|nr:hypothetical protein Nepgr_004669 [Nepenthes gracilis]